MKKEINGVREELCCFIRRTNDILGLGMCFLVFIDILIPSVCFLQPFCCFPIDSYSVTSKFWTWILLQLCGPLNRSDGTNRIDFFLIVDFAFY